MTKQAYFILPSAFDPLLSPPHRSGKRAGPLALQFKGAQTAKHLVESLGIPHIEIAEIRVAAEVKELDYRPKDGDRIEVLPIHGNRPGDSLYPGDTARFVVDNHLGKLTTYLRILGFDAWYRPDYEDAELASISETHERVLLTRDRQLLMRKRVKYGCWIRPKQPKEQARYVLERFELRESVDPFRRCLRCNHPLEAVEKAHILPRLEPLTRKYYDKFYLCPACDQVYWPGSHYEHMREFIAELNSKS